MFPHGAQKVLGTSGGMGFTNTMHLFTSTLHIPVVFAFLAILAEFAGSVGLVLGFLSRLCALGITVNMVVAILKVHAAYGFFMNWTGKQAGEGYEYHILAIGLGLVVLLQGGGKWSLDGFITRALDRKSTA